MSRYVNLAVAIYECESTGGSEWLLEDTISLKNIELRADLPNFAQGPGFDSTHGMGGKKNLEKFAQNFADDQDSQEMKENLKGRVDLLSQCRLFSSLAQFYS